MSGSIRFDRAAEFYDQTRAISDAAMGRTLDVLGAELAGREPVLEVGVGTGLLGLGLHDRGVELTGIDLSEPMMRRLVEKAGGRPPFPLVLGDATGMPFADGSFGGAYLRWVLHLIPDWRGAVREIARVVRPGGVLIANLGGYGDAREEIQRRFADLAGIDITPVGLDWDDLDALDAEMDGLGARPRELPSVPEVLDLPLGRFIDFIDEGRWSWTWGMDDELRHGVTSELRPWAEERFGPLDAAFEQQLEMRWRAYDLA